MNKSKKNYVYIASVVIIGLVGVVLVLAGVLKLLNVGAEDMIEGLVKSRLIQHKTAICLLAIICGSLLLVPFTRKIGILMSTAYWGGAIVAHMTYDDSVVMPASFLALLWSGVVLSHCATKSAPPPQSGRDVE